MQKVAALKRTGCDTHRAELSYEPGVVKEVTDLTDEGQVVPEKFILTWVRPAGGCWQRNSLGSYAYGYRKGGMRKARRMLFAVEPPFLRGWATLMPGLRAEIEKIESSLPD